jgi:hypothetical protein
LGEKGGDMMTNKKYLIIAVLATFCLTATLFMIVPTRSQSGSYDARTDVNGDGTIDMADISIGIDGFMTNGDPTLNVSVTNWPKSSDVLVWWGRSLVDGAYVVSNYYYSDGYSTLHMLIDVGGLTGNETCVFYVAAPLWNATHNSNYPIAAYTYTFAYGDYKSAVSVDVPSEEFYFEFDAATGTNCTVALSYYLTWA